jgi:hypothetical protein
MYRREEPPRYEAGFRAHGSNQRFHRLLRHAVARALTTAPSLAGVSPAARCILTPHRWRRKAPPGTLSQNSGVVGDVTDIRAACGIGSGRRGSGGAGKRRIVHPVFGVTNARSRVCGPTAVAFVPGITGRRLITYPASVGVRWSGVRLVAPGLPVAGSGIAGAWFVLAAGRGPGAGEHSTALAARLSDLAQGLGVAQIERCLVGLSEVDNDSALGGL